MMNERIAANPKITIIGWLAFRLKDALTANENSCTPCKMPSALCEVLGCLALKFFTRNFMQKFLHCVREMKWLYSAPLKCFFFEQKVTERELPTLSISTCSSWSLPGLDFDGIVNLTASTQFSMEKNKCYDAANSPPKSTFFFKICLHECQTAWQAQQHVSHSSARQCICRPIRHKSHSVESTLFSCCLVVSIVSLSRCHPSECLMKYNSNKVEQMFHTNGN